MHAGVSCPRPPTSSSGGYPGCRGHLQRQCGAPTGLWPVTPPCRAFCMQSSWTQVRYPWIRRSQGSCTSATAHLMNLIILELLNQEESKCIILYYLQFTLCFKHLLSDSQCNLSVSLSTVQILGRGHRCHNFSSVAHHQHKLQRVKTSLGKSGFQQPNAVCTRGSPACSLDLTFVFPAFGFCICIV